MSETRHDFAARRKTVRRGREKGCWLYVPAEVLESIGYPPDGPPPFSKCWPGRKRTLLVQLYGEK